MPVSGLFWTVPIPPESVVVDFEAGTATMSVDMLPVPDALSGSDDQAIPATVSLVMQWFSSGVAQPYADPTLGFTGNYQEGTATIAWSAAEEGFSFVSDPGASSQTRFAQFGQENTGIFAAAGGYVIRPARAGSFPTPRGLSSSGSDNV